MAKIIDKKVRRKIRKRRSKIIIGSSERPRVVLSESNRYLRVQAIDDKIGHTLAYSSTEELVEGTSYSRKNKVYAQKLAEMFAEKLKKEGKKSIIFDRNGRPYQTRKEKEKKASGKLKVFCDTLRELGINF